MILFTFLKITHGFQLNGDEWKLGNQSGGLYTGQEVGRITDEYPVMEDFDIKCFMTGKVFNSVESTLGSDKNRTET